MTVGLSKLLYECDFADAGPLATLEVFNEELPEDQRRTENELWAIYEGLEGEPVSREALL